MDFIQKDFLYRVQSLRLVKKDSRDADVPAQSHSHGRAEDRGELKEPMERHAVSEQENQTHTTVNRFITMQPDDVSPDKNLVHYNCI